MLCHDLSRRLDRLEARRTGFFGARRHVMLELSADLVTRIEKAMAAGAFPQALCDADLEAIVAAGDRVRENGP